MVASVETLDKSLLTIELCKKKTDLTLYVNIVIIFETWIKNVVQADLSSLSSMEIELT